METVGASGRFAQNGTQGKRGSWVVCDLFWLREWKFSVAREGPQNVDPSRWSGRVKGTPGGRGTLKKKNQVKWEGIGGGLVAL